MHNRGFNSHPLPASSPAMPFRLSLSDLALTGNMISSISLTVSATPTVIRHKSPQMLWVFSTPTWGKVKKGNGEDPFFPEIMLSCPSV